MLITRLMSITRPVSSSYFYPLPFAFYFTVTAIAFAPQGDLKVTV